MSKIIGVTVGTPTSPAAMEEKIKPVKSVNGNFPDESGNVEIDVPEGADGQRGTGILKTTTAPSSYTTAIGSYVPKYRIALSTLKSQSKVDTVLIGDIIQNSYYQYQIDYLDSSYAYISATRVSLRGATGAAGAAGSDANVTAENITAALGYTPANPDDITAVEEVYRGPEPPTDPNVKLWVNTSKPGGGTSAPADWDAAEGEPGHILNRTHYTETGEVILPETVLEDMEGQFMAAYEGGQLVDGQLYEVTYNGEVYTSKCVYSDGGFLLGYLPVIADLAEEKPFMFAVVEGMIMLVAYDGATSVTVSIKQLVVHPIKEHFLPSNLQTYVIDMMNLNLDDKKHTQVSYDEIAAALYSGRRVVLRLNDFETFYSDFNVVSWAWINTELTAALSLSYIGTGREVETIFFDNGTWTPFG